MQTNHQDDFSETDPRLLTPDQWVAFRARLMENARRERAKAISTAIGTLIAWMRRAFWRLLKRRPARATWISLLRSHRERIAAAELRGMSDQWLADMGVTRGEIAARVCCSARRHRFGPR